MTTFCITHGQEHRPDDEVTDDVGCLNEEWTRTVPGTVLSSQCEPETASYFVIESGDLVYIMSEVGGLVPAKVHAIDDDVATVRITGTRPGFTRGQALDFLVPNLSILARPQVQVIDDRLSTEGPTRFLNDNGSLI